LDQVSYRRPRNSRHVDEYVGERIRERRTALGLTQEHLASALDISYQQIQKYETGSNRISAGRLYEISLRLGVDVGYFFSDLNPAERDGPMPHGGRNRTTIDLVRNYTDINDPSVRAAVSTLVKSLAGKKAKRSGATSADGEE